MMRQLKCDENSKKISNMFTTSRTIAIICVISAHITIETSETVNDIYNVIGSIGVIAFLIMSGYFYRKYPVKLLIQKKFISVIIPYLVIGSLVYLIPRAVNGTEITFKQLILWLLGYQTYLYYVVILVVCFALFYYSNTLTLCIAIALNGFSLAFTANGHIDPIIVKLHLTNYLNVFNWMGFFALGMLLAKANKDKLWMFIKKSRYIWIAASALCTIIIMFYNLPIGYFSPIGWMYEIISAFAIFSVCTFDFTYNKVTEKISKVSYAVYLLHMLFVGIISDMLAMNLIVSAFSCVIVLALTCCIIYFGKYIAYKAKLGRLYNLFIGLRE